MNIKMIGYVIGKILRIEFAFIFIPFLISFFYNETYILKNAYIITMVLIAAVSYVLSMRLPKNTKIYVREGYFIVSLSWILMSIFAAFPFFISGEIPSYIDAFFEVVSGFTTTGASILTNVELLSNSLLFLRSFTHFVGGMGVLVLAIAILPQNNNDSLSIMRAEVPGPVFGKLVSKMAYNSRILYLIYIAIVILIIIFLKIGDMPLFDSILHAFGAAGTGGFAMKNNSVAYYNSAYIEYVLGVGMILCGLNFNLFYWLLLKNFKQVYKNEEMRLYLKIIIISIVLICVNLYPQYKNISRLFRDVFFTVSSIITTTGFSTVDFDKWTTFSKMILLILMFVGGCAGSTAGGVKVSRILILFKSMKGQIKRSEDPNRVTTIKMDGVPINKEVFARVSNYIILLIVISIASVLLVAWDIPDIQSAISAVAATINNIGPGLGAYGPTSNYSSLSGISKIVLSICMLLGRLEIFPILILFSPRLYKKMFNNDDK
ncbi:MAG: TrkH family potassium uptake protein [Fusobacteriaceae bacterium]|jgi:trk system potassium uptake protein TrkH|nr:TrkH family potassium uptake protein [Fusobacteriaceae bacterium]